MSDTFTHGSASLTLSHPDSDSSSTGRGFPGDASGESSSSSSVLSACSVLDSPSSKDSSSSHVEFSSDNASGIPSVSSLEDGA